MKKAIIFATMLHKLVVSLLLLLFLFPLVEKGIHAFEHEDEEDCLAYEDIHLHEKHHDCKLCDYNIEPAQKTPIDFKLVTSSKSLKIDFLFESILIETSLYYFSLRAPPVIS
jgi:hypothetical protein